MTVIEAGANHLDALGALLMTGTTVAAVVAISRLEGYLRKGQSRDRLLRY